MTKAEKILLTLARLCEARESAVTYEDLVVAAFEAYPEDFALRGYPQYPDASDIHKPIYNQLKPQGLVRVSNKTFRITEAGLRVVGRMDQELLAAETSQRARRLTRGQERALRRYESSSALQLVSEGREEQLIDTDTQRFYGFAPWTSPAQASARRSELLSILDVLAATDASRAKQLKKTDDELRTRFAALFEEG